MFVFLTAAVLLALAVGIIATGWATGGGIAGLIKGTGFWNGFRTSFLWGIVVAFGIGLGVVILGGIFHFFVNIFVG